MGLFPFSIISSPLKKSFFFLVPPTTMDRFRCVVNPPPSSVGVTATGLYEDMRVLAGCDDPSVFRGINMEPGVGVLRDRNGVEILGGGAPGVVANSFLIWRPGGVAADNVVPGTSTDLNVALAISPDNDNVTRVYVDSSLGEAIVDEDLALFGRVELVAWTATTDPGQGFPFARINVAMGFAINDAKLLQGLQIRGDTGSNTNAPLQWVAATAPGHRAKIDTCQFLEMAPDQPIFEIEYTEQTRMEFTGPCFISHGVNTEPTILCTADDTPQAHFDIGQDVIIQTEPAFVLAISTGMGGNITFSVAGGSLSGIANTSQTGAVALNWNVQDADLVEFIDAPPNLVPLALATGPINDVAAALKYLKRAEAVSIRSFVNSNHAQAFTAALPGPFEVIQNAGTLDTRFWTPDTSCPQPTGLNARFVVPDGGKVKVSVIVNLVTSAGGPARLNLSIQNAALTSSASPTTFKFEVDATPHFEQVTGVFYLDAVAADEYAPFITWDSGSDTTLIFADCIVDAIPLHADTAP